MAATYVGFQKWTERMVEAGNNATDSWRLALTNSLPDITTDTTITRSGKRRRLPFANSSFSGVGE